MHRSYTGSYVGHPNGHILGHLIYDVRSVQKDKERSLSFHCCRGRHTLGDNSANLPDGTQPPELQAVGEGGRSSNSADDDDVKHNSVDLSWIVRTARLSVKSCKNGS